MRVFERDDDRWEITISEQQVDVRRFRGDALVENTRTPHGSPLRAKWEADRFCTQLVQRGYARTSGEAAPIAQGELEAALRANPDDHDAYLVYADWLSERGDDWGKLIVVQHALATLPRFGATARRDQLSREEATLLFRLGARLWGRLGETIYDLQSQKYWSDLVEAEWRCGFLYAIRIRNVDENEFVTLIDGLRDVPAAMVLRSMHLYPDIWTPAMVAAVAKRPWPTLQELVIDDEAVHAQLGFLARPA